MIFQGVRDDGYYYVSGHTKSYRVPADLRTADEIRAWVIRQLKAGNIDKNDLYQDKKLPSNQPQVERVLRPYGNVKPWKGELGGAQLTATPVGIKGKQITWRIEVERGGQKLGAFETKLTGQIGPAQFKEGSPLKKQVLSMVPPQTRAPSTPNPLDSAIVKSRQSGVPVRVEIPVDGATYHRIMGNTLSPAKPVLDLFVINVPAQLRAPGSTLKPPPGQALGNLGVTPLREDGAGGATYVLPNNRLGGQLFAKALQSADHQPLLGGDKSQIPAGANEEFKKGFNEANSAATIINWMNLVNHSVVMVGMIAPFMGGRGKPERPPPNTPPNNDNTIDMRLNPKTGVFEPVFPKKGGEIRPNPTKIQKWDEQAMPKLDYSKPDEYFRLQTPSEVANEFRIRYRLQIPSLFLLHMTLFHICCKLPMS